MKRVMLVSLMAALFVMSTAGAQEEKERVAQFILDFRPGSFLFSPDMDGFTVTDGTLSETVDGTASYTPSVNAGVGFDFGTVNLNITGGLGYLYNNAFHGGFAQFDIATLFELVNGKLRMGPHVGLVGLGDANWDDAGQIDLEGNGGFKGGLTLHAGGQRVAFLANIDFVDASYDIKTRGGWSATDGNGTTVTELDMSGVIIDLGLILRF
ncbi:hypothetical protein ACFL6U_25535 [Planctomycetota bacterium]